MSSSVHIGENMCKITGSNFVIFPKYANLSSCLSPVIFTDAASDGFSSQKVLFSMINQIIRR